MFKLIFGTLFVVQVCLAVPAPTPVGPIDAGHPDLNQLVQNAGATYMEFFSFAVEKYKDLFERVLTKSEADANSDPQLKAALMPFAKFVNWVRTGQSNRETLQEQFDECTALADRYDRGVPVDASAAEKKVAKYMNEEHAMKTKFDILMKYITSLQQFVNTVRKYLDSVRGDDQEINKKLRRWYTNWQREHDWEKKDFLMLNFFQIFDKSKTDRERLSESSVRIILTYLHTVVVAHQELFRRGIKAIETEIPNPDDSVKQTLEKMKQYVAQVDKLEEHQGVAGFEELLKLFQVVQERRRWYNSNNIPESEQKVAKIMGKNGEVETEVREMILTFGVGEKLTKDVEEYFETIHDDQAQAENNLRGWLEDVMEEREYEVRAGKLVDLIHALRTD